MAGRNRVPILAIILCASFFVDQIQAQIPVRDFQALQGPWECRNSTGAAGVLITAQILLSQQGGEQGIASQSVNIRVYQRRGQAEHGGYFSPSDGSTVFDGKRLIIRFKDRTDISALNLDVRFDQTRQRWTGSFSLCDDPRDVVLDRPRAQESPQSPFVGDWQGSVTGTLHIRQDYDGGLSAWLDNTPPGLIHADQWNGVQLYVMSATQSTIILETVNASGALGRYQGTLSSDGKQLSSQWHVNGSGTTNAPPFYRVRLLDRPIGRN
jgi:hypothetical protein